MTVHNLIADLIAYAGIHLELADADAVYVRNLLYSRFKVTEHEDCVCDTARLRGLKCPDAVLNPLIEYAEANGLTEAGGGEALGAEVMGLVSLTPSQVEARFNSFADKKKACGWLYDYNIKNDYIRLTAVSKNIAWDAANGLKITINLSKPEKSNRETAALRGAAQTGYPKCVICYDNVGFAGGGGKPARQNLRVIPVRLGGEEWFWQYSPYVYYPQHCIVIDRVHRPMDVGAKTFPKLFDFVDAYPHFFLGANASLPIIGGSILSHDHFQGGGTLMPMHRAGERARLRCADFKNLELSLPDWFNSVLRIKGRDKKAMCALAGRVFEKWKDYGDAAENIIASTGGVPHNSVTPSLRKDGRTYILDIIFRNNRTDAERPDGIFHASKKYHNIKAEAIGLIEAAGMFILPARLDGQLKAAAEFLAGKPFKEAELPEDMRIHAEFIRAAIDKHGANLVREKAAEAVRREVENVCENILYDTAVFKSGAAFARFLAACGIERRGGNGGAASVNP